MTASIIFDVLMVVLAALIILKFSLKGCIRSFISLGKIVVSIAIALLLRVLFVNALNAIIMDSLMIDVVRNSLTASIENNLAKVYINVDSLPEAFKQFLTKFDLNLEDFNKNSEALFVNNDTSVIEPLAQNIGGALATLISSIIAVVVVFIISYIILSIVCKIFIKSEKLDSIKTIDRILGAVWGILLACILLWAFTQVALFVVDVVGPLAPEFIKAEFAEKSWVVRIFKRPYVIDDIMKKFVS